MSLMRSTAWSALAVAMLSGGRFLLAMLLARKLEVHDFGRFTFTQWLVDTVFICLAFGLGGSGNRFYAEYSTRPPDLRAFHHWLLPRAFAVVVLVSLASPVAAVAFDQRLDAGETAIQSLWSASAAIWALLLARAQGLKRFRRIAVSNTGYVLVAIGGVLLLPAGKVDLGYAMLIVLAATVTAVVLVWVPLPAIEDGAPPPTVEGTALRRFAMNIWIAEMVAAVVWSRGELSVVRTMMTTADVAQYAVALQLASIAVIGTMLLTGALLPHITSLWGTGEHDAMVAVSRRATDWLLLAAGTLGAAMIAFGPELVRVAFGAEFDRAHEPLAILGLGTLGLVSASSIQLAQLASDARFNRNANAAGAVAVLLLSVALVPSYGIIGASIGRTVAWVAVGIGFMLFASWRVDRRAVAWTNLAVGSAFTVGFFVFVTAIEPDLPIRALGWLVLGLALSISIRDAVDGRSLAAQAIARIRGAATRGA